MTEYAKMKLRKNDPKKSKLTWTKIFNITIFLLSIIILMVNSESGGIWFLELTTSKLTSQIDSSVSCTNEKGMVTINITFLLARKLDVGKMNREGKDRHTIQGTYSDFWTCVGKRTVWKPGLGERKIKIVEERKKVSHNDLWETGGWKETACNVMGQTGQAKLARSNKKSHSKLTEYFKSGKIEAQQVKLAEHVSDRAQSKLAMPESEGGRRREQAKLASMLITKELDRAQSKEIAMPRDEWRVRIEQAKLAFLVKENELDRAQGKELAMPVRGRVQRIEQVKLASPGRKGALLKQNLSVKNKSAQQDATALVMRGKTRAQHKGVTPKDRWGGGGVSNKKDKRKNVFKRLQSSSRGKRYELRGLRVQIGTTNTLRAFGMRRGGVWNGLRARDWN